MVLIISNWYLYYHDTSNDFIIITLMIISFFLNKIYNRIIELKVNEFGWIISYLVEMNLLEIYKTYE